ncbi:hypothetical protein SEVIR_5G430200v4 [Setaria viridis]|uniref:DUF538 domain-containing protein n=2 Tax=Setaria TaxID=4554 RepID=K3XMG0_SETIT|nr:uncharacterized protein LOC101777469 [Setaria italica]XP_034597386.1 uncharacterized protein LOC117858427 [Setaria viridis]RCV28711.1 hypothetical protein SETIT_5G424600v2 [Setaria italica]TKW18430.1 hypothetical protein SEVIR_5G430200v2 [Setaria viridis]
MAAALRALLLAAAAAVVLLASGARGAAGRTAAAEAANAVLRAHQLPGGLLPAGITAFRHDAATGAFEADLAAPCTTRFEVELRYNATVAGVISRGRIAAISGVAAQDLFIWFPVHDITVDIPSSGVIYFNVGVVKKHFPLALFDAPPACTPDRLLRTTPQRLEDVDLDGLLISGSASQ